MPALSIRQPWAWLIANGYKDVENRTWPTQYRGLFYIHAGKVMTRSDYESAVIFCSALDLAKEDDLWFPTFEIVRAQTGGIVGEAVLVDCVTESKSKWFCGDYGFVLARARPVTFVPCKGALGFFTP